MGNTSIGNNISAYNQVNRVGGVTDADPHRLVSMLLEGALGKIATVKGLMIRNDIAKKGEGVHHIAFKTDDTNEALKIIGEKGIKLIDKQERNGAEGLKIGFLHPKSTFGVLTELCSE